ncbi:MAG: S46 family peptidase [Bacteroidaceae bacterium]
MKTKSFVLVFILFLFSSLVKADEGMWLIGNLAKNKQACQAMKELGLQMPVSQLYNLKHPSLKDAVVSFGGFCSGVVVSEDGLVFTNHHCGFNCIRQHSTVEHDYLKDGFIAHNHQEELPNPELYVRFLISTKNVTRRVLKAINVSMNELARTAAIDSVKSVIIGEIGKKDSTLVGVVDTFYGGNEFWLSVYRDFTDIRLVFAPPSSIGKFGWNTDNWMWPRHVGDFSVFRIYADSLNRPANYSPNNVPYHPKYVAPISLDGYKEGSFSMTIGYPGVTERYLSSYGVEEKITCINRPMIDVRNVKQAIWKREMDKDEATNLKYAAKYDESSNFWKNSIGMNKALRNLDVVKKKQKAEEQLQKWINENPSEKKYRNLLASLKENYAKRYQTTRAINYFAETFLNGPELIQLALDLMNFDFDDKPKAVAEHLNKLVEQYGNMDTSIDKEVFVALLKKYQLSVDSIYLPCAYQVIDTVYHGNVQLYADSLYAHSQLSSPMGLKRFLERDSTFDIYKDPAVEFGIDLIVKYFEMSQGISDVSREIDRSERLLNAVIRKMYDKRNFYPDANSTMRLSFGSVCGYSPRNGIYYDDHTTVEGLLKKVKLHLGDIDFAVGPKVLSLLSSRQFGRYADDKGNMDVCFITNNDITGGNSGSAMFNEKGQLMGLAFDGNWEGMSGDVAYNAQLQRCIGVDIRYVLFVIDKYGKADNLMQELNITR